LQLCRTEYVHSLVGDDLTIIIVLNLTTSTPGSCALSRYLQLCRTEYLYSLVSDDLMIIIMLLPGITEHDLFVYFLHCYMYAGSSSIKAPTGQRISASGLPGASEVEPAREAILVRGLLDWGRER